MLETTLREDDPSATCTLNADDPPDIVCWKGRKTIAVEVTQLHQRLDEGGESLPWAARAARLERFGASLRARFEPHLTSRHIVNLEGPQDIRKWKEWEDQVTDDFSRYVSSNPGKRRRVSGAEFWASDGEPHLTVMMGVPFGSSLPSGAMNQDIEANITQMLSHALDDKEAKLAGISGFDEKALLLINTYPLADEVGEVRRVLASVLGVRANCEFDRIYYLSLGVLSTIHSK